MKKVTAAKIIAFIFLFSAGMVSADEEMREWYLSEDDNYLVRESIYGNLHALLSVSKAGEPNVYIVMSDSDCEGDSGDVTVHDSLYINGVLTRYQQYCDDSDRYFFPATDAGTNHIINEFKKKNFVTIMNYDGSSKSVFSAKGFTAVYNRVVYKETGI